MSTIRIHSEPMVLRVARAVASYIGFGEEDIDLNVGVADDPAASPKPRTQHPVPKEPSLRLMPNPDQEKQHSSHKWRRHPQLRAYESPLPEDVRRGRNEAVRGLFAARAGALDVATRLFAAAAECPDVDLTAVPGFWNLTRGQMQTAVDAYEHVGRYRDAAALDAHIMTIFRPSLVGSSNKPIVPARQQHKAAST